jgi:hypothetical protein
MVAFLASGRLGLRSQLYVSNMITDGTRSKALVALSNQSSPMARVASSLFFQSDDSDVSGTAAHAQRKGHP